MCWIVFTVKPPPLLHGQDYGSSRGAYSVTQLSVWPINFAPLERQAVMLPHLESLTFAETLTTQMEFDSLSLLLLGTIGAVTFYAIRTNNEPDIHPLLLNHQADVSNIRFPGESAVYRSKFAPHGGPLLTSSDRAVKTVYELWRNGGVKTSADQDFLGVRQGGGPYIYQTYDEVDSRVKNFGSGLLEITKLAPRTESILGIFIQNSPEYVIAELATSHYSLVTLPIPEKQSPESLSGIINLTSLQAILVNNATLPIALAAAPSSPSLKHIILAEIYIPDDVAAEAKEKGITLTKFSAVEEVGLENKREPVPPGPDDLAVICFTNGTTQEPKPVMLSHQNLVANVSACFAILPQTQKLTREDRHFSYMPLAYTFERTILYLHIFVGASIAFYRGDLNISKLFNDAEEAKPTVFASTPKYLARFQETIESSLGGSFLFKKGYEVKRKLLLEKGRLVHDSKWDFLVFRAIRNKLGGAIRVVISGSAPVDPKLLTWYRITLGCPVVQTYGLTEATSAVTLSNVFEYNEEGSVGAVVPCCEIKLVDFKDYTSADQPNPRGEICVRGPSVMKGYYKNDDLTSKTIRDEWLHTGDLGMMLPNGTLKVLGRINA
ncbi:uncharacterized protein VTP21DRAFT_10520 [Calcarisporiella thermophila]|uniref:uncharacterized protein n=1 Tax=Calcarisporiella thermophila TaxID=911321 RepID=UPI0037429AF6